MSITANALGRVLVVDDELGPRESLRMLLKPSYAIQTAENGRTALDLLRRFQPDVVIMDIKMPEMDGLELLRHVKRADPSIERPHSRGPSAPTARTLACVPSPRRPRSRAAGHGRSRQWACLSCRNPARNELRPRPYANDLANNHRG